MMNIQDKVLVVDDNPVNVDILQESLGNKCNLKVATSGEEALEIASQFKPNVILLDIMMPGIDGYETCRRIRKNPQLRFIKIIMVSAKAMINERLEGYNSGADDYLTKPFDDDELYSKVKVFLKLKFTEEIDRLKSNLLSLISHELRTPLNSIIGFSSILSKSTNLEDKERMYLQNVINGGNKILEFSKKALLLCDLKEASSLNLESISIDMFIKKITKKLQIKASTAGIRIVIGNRLDKNVDIDQFLMEHALTFVLENAIKFSPHEGVVSIAAELCKNNLLIKVEDQGKGIDEKEMQSMFDEFSVDDVSHHSEGQGLSLAIAQNIAKIHGGELSAGNRSEEGAVFVFKIPLGNEK